MKIRSISLVVLLLSTGINQGVEPGFLEKRIVALFNICLLRQEWVKKSSDASYFAEDSDVSLDVSEKGHILFSSKDLRRYSARNNEPKKELKRWIMSFRCYILRS